ncbi:uncharacterized protein TNCV_2806301 [Trichonephila clavipes]|nr:uncharacterized protein TNCV_2806301 [Trichonephila clavipes]
MWTTPELAPPLLTTTPHQRDYVSVLDRFSVLRCPTRGVFSGAGLELVRKPTTIRYLYHSGTAALVYRSRCMLTLLQFKALPLGWCEVLENGESA